jgi:DNA-binding winged helix-turn-helix (wHTH) protein
MDAHFEHVVTEIELGFTFGDLRLEPDGTLLRGDEPIHLTPKELAALRVLLANPGRIVTPTQLKQILWPDVHVTADSVPRCLSSLRSRLGPGVSIHTIYKRGYRLDSPVHRHAPAAANTLPRLAILPFAAGMFVPEHLGPSIAENAAARLNHLHPPIVRVLARESISTLAGRGFTVLETGRKLGADIVLAGTLQTSALFLRLRVELIRVSEGTQVWVEDVLAPRERPAVLEQRLMDRLAYRLGGQLPISISASHDATASDDSDVAAYDAFLEGRYESRAPDDLRMRNAMDLLHKASALGRNNLAAREQLARLSVNQCLYGYASPASTAEQIRRAADANPEIENSSGAILPALGWILFHVEHQLAFALRMFNETIHGAWALRLRVMLALSRSHFDEALGLLEPALRDDPYSPSLHAQLAWTHHLAGSEAESLDEANRCLALFPGDERAELCAALILAFNHDAHRAAEIAHEVALRRRRLDIASAIEAYALAKAGLHRDSEPILERLQWLGRERYVMRAFTAAAYAELGDVDNAIAELQAAEEARCPWFFQTLADPRLRSLHGNPSFERMRTDLQSMEATVAADSACLV